MWRGLSLANKCLLLFGGAVVIIVVTALLVPWFRMIALIDLGQLEVSRQMVARWKASESGTTSRDPFRYQGPFPERIFSAQTSGTLEPAGVSARRIGIDQARREAEKDPFLKRALRALDATRGRADYQEASFSGGSREYFFAQAEFATGAKAAGVLTEGYDGGELRIESIILLQRRPVEATELVLFNAAFLLSAGSVILSCSLAVFYFLTHKVVLAPVRSLKETAERVRRGNLEIRSDITTGDEFEELSETFNSMLNDLETSHNQLRGINSALDVKLGELAQSNTALYEAAKLKGDFLANVSHELRTPLNSIIGFAELLLDIARADAAAGDSSPVVSKRIRYGENIVVAGRNLLGMINSLLEMAKIEAGRVELHPAPVNLKDAAETLLALIHPLAAKKGIAPKLEIGDDVPTIVTDPKKLQQIIFNFLSNAVKFTEPAERTGRAPLLTLRVERLIGGEGPVRAGAPAERVRISVIDNGPGISPEEQDRVFDKFHQVDASHTREHSGTGLGLAISKELAALLNGEIQLVSEVGRGSMFSLMLPLTLEVGSDEGAGSPERAGHGKATALGAGQDTFGREQPGVGGPNR